CLSDRFDHFHDVTAVGESSAELLVRMPIGAVGDIYQLLANGIQTSVREDDSGHLIERHLLTCSALPYTCCLPHRLVDERDRVRGRGEVEPLQYRRPQAWARHVSAFIRAVIQQHCSDPMTCQHSTGRL